MEKSEDVLEYDKIQNSSSKKQRNQQQGSSKRSISPVGLNGNNGAWELRKRIRKYHVWFSRASSMQYKDLFNQSESNHQKKAVAKAPVHAHFKFNSRISTRRNKAQPIAEEEEKKIISIFKKNDGYIRIGQHYQADHLDFSKPCFYSTTPAMTDFQKHNLKRKLAMQKVWNGTQNKATCNHSLAYTHQTTSSSSSCRPSSTSRSRTPTASPSSTCTRATWPSSRTSWRARTASSSTRSKVTHSHRSSTRLAALHQPQKAQNQEIFMTHIHYITSNYNHG